MEFESGLEHLKKTWFIDLDGTLLIHNGYKDSADELLPTTTEFMNTIGSEDIIIITTAREIKYKKQTIDFLKKKNIRFNHILFGLPSGPRILINDKKPDGTKTAYSLNVERNVGVKLY
jgi:hypothetical protein